MTAEQSKELLLSVQGLKKNFGEREILKGIDFDVHKGDVVCVIGPSGSGKSTLIRCVNYLEQPTDGVISYRGENVLECFKNLPLYRTKVGMVFQQFNLFNNMTVLENCVVGQVKVLGKKSEEAKAIAMKYLEHVGMASYINAKPHQLSGGMRQRVMIAMALAGDPELLIADEPTTALDVTIQAQILDLLKSLQKKLNMWIIIITHDLGVISEMADEVVVMYAGEIVEKAKTRELFDDPKHPYTVGLMNSVPDVDEDVERLRTLEGLVPSLYDMPKGCRFAPRCQFACPECEKERIKLLDLEDGRQVRCRSIRNCIILPRQVSVKMSCGNQRLFQRRS